MTTVLKTMQIPEDVRDYVRSKGLEDRNLTPLELLKEQLFLENNTRLPQVDYAVGVREVKILLDSLSFNSRHMETVDAREPKPLPGAKLILGVVSRTKLGNLQLLDDYHRVIWAQSAGWSTGTFLELLHD